MPAFVSAPFLSRLCLLALSAQAATLDRIAVTVEKRVISEADVIRDLRVAAFLDRRPLDLSGPAKRQAASRLVDQVLILQEAADSHVALSSPEDIPRLLDSTRLQFASEAEYRAALAEYHITDADLASHLLDGLRALRFSDLRFRPQTQISEADLKEYYDKQVADWRKSNSAPAPSFEASREEIEKLLSGERAMTALDEWLEITRAQKRIVYREAVFQ